MARARTATSSEAVIGRIAHDQRAGPPVTWYGGRVSGPQAPVPTPRWSTSTWTSTVSLDRRSAVVVAAYRSASWWNRAVNPKGSRRFVADTSNPSPAASVRQNQRVSVWLPCSWGNT